MLKISSYNIFNGGLDPQKRFQQVCDAINNLDVAIIFLQELDGWEPANVYGESFSSATGMKLFVGESGETSPKKCGIAIKNHSNFEFEQIDPKEIFHGTEYLHVKPAVLKITTREYEFFAASIHLPHFSKSLSKMNAEIIASSIANQLLLGGDFNAVCTNDINGKENLSSSTKKYARCIESSESMNVFEKHGFTLSSGLESSVPTKHSNSIATFPQIRTDYFMASQKLDIEFQNFKVIKNELTDYCSDHYPVVAEIFS
mgnify:FL=1|jgi:endonuclease/exonuclease/phosphatase family metal-dependent hydrolase